MSVIVVKRKENNRNTNTVITKKMMKKIMSVVIVICMLCSLTACGAMQNMRIRSLLSDFQEACNLNDLSTALDYIVPSISDKIKVATGIVGMFSQKSEEEMFIALANMLSGEKLSDVNFFTTLDIEIQEIIVAEDGESAVAETIVTYDLFGDQNVREAFFDCEYYAEEWYISGFSFA